MQSTEMSCLSEHPFLSRLIDNSKITKQTALGKTAYVIQILQTKETAMVISYDLLLLLYLELFAEYFMRVSTESLSRHHLLGLGDDHVSFKNKIKHYKQMVEVVTYRSAGTLAETIVK